MSARLTKSGVRKLFRGSKPRTLPGGVNAKVRQRYNAMKKAGPKWINDLFLDSFFSQSPKTEEENRKEPLIYLAVLRLTSPARIRKFYNWYVNYLRGRKDIKHDPELLARQWIAYYTENWSSAKVDLWRRALKEKYVPIFGTPVERSTKGRAIRANNSGIQAGRDYLHDRSRRN